MATRRPVRAASQNGQRRRRASARRPRRVAAGVPSPRIAAWKAAERARVEDAALDRQRRSPSALRSDDLADGLLGHHVPPEQRALGAVHLEAGAGIFRREAVVQLRERPERKRMCRHDPVLDARLRHAARTG